MEFESEIKQLKDEEQKIRQSDITCWNCFGLMNKTAVTQCGIFCLFIGVLLLTGSWSAILWPLAIVGLGIYLIMQNNGAKA